MGVYLVLCERIHLIVIYNKYPPMLLDFQSNWSPPFLPTLFWIYHCPIALLPIELVNYQNLAFLHMHNTTLIKFNIPIRQFPHLKQLWLQSAGNMGPALPTTLEKLGPVVTSIKLRNVNIKTLPNNFSESWKSQTRWLDLRGNDWSISQCN